MFAQDQNETGTPFVEIDSDVAEYVSKCADDCVREMFGRMTYSDETVCAVFPFKNLSTSFSAGSDFDAEKEKQSNDTVRGWIRTMKQAIDENLNMNDAKVLRKAEHYKAALDNQLAQCDRADEVIDMLKTPFPQGRM